VARGDHRKLKTASEKIIGGHFRSSAVVVRGHQHQRAPFLFSRKISNANEFIECVFDGRFDAANILLGDAHSTQYAQIAFMTRYGFDAMLAQFNLVGAGDLVSQCDNRRESLSIKICRLPRPARFTACKNDNRVARFCFFAVNENRCGIAQQRLIRQVCHGNQNQKSINEEETPS